MKLLLILWTLLNNKISSFNTRFNSIMIVLIKLKNIGKETIKLHSKYNLNSKCILKENNSKEKKLQSSKYKLNSELITQEKNSKNNKLKISIKKIYDILHTKQLSSKKYSEVSLSENIYITFIKEKNNSKLYKEKINNLNNHWINLVKHKPFKLKSIRSNYRKHNLQHWLKIYII